MQDKLLGWLEDIRLAADSVIRFVGDLDLPTYLGDDLRRSAIERQLITLGVAMVQFAKDFPAEAATINEWREAISFRNILVHRYRTLDHVLIYRIIRTKLPALRDQVAAKIAKLENLQ
jgi:uncharacterized protein with HEPN domain